MDSLEQLLGVKHGASRAELKTAYYTLAKQHHPDKGGECAHFQKITHAFTALYKHCTIKDQNDNDVDIIDAFENPRDLMTVVMESLRTNTASKAPTLSIINPYTPTYPLVHVSIRDVYNGTTKKLWIKDKWTTVKLFPFLRNGSIYTTKHKQCFTLRIDPYGAFSHAGNTNHLHYTMTVASTEKIVQRIVLLDDTVIWVQGTNLDLNKKYVVCRYGMPFGIMVNKQYHHRGHGNLIITLQYCQTNDSQVHPMDQHRCLCMHEL